DVFVVINILSNRSKWTFYFLQSVQVNFTIGRNKKIDFSK
ncbi:XRE family transcriptional regulator, partial [Lactobacillus crispatus]|nr:XRE family transcriptional regulator [Lactobacillus crispatus]